MTTNQQQPDAAGVRRIAECFHPGEFLRDELQERGMNAEALARAISGKRHAYTVDVIQSVLEEKVSMTEHLSFRLHLLWGTSPAFWMNLQRSYDDWKAEAKKKEQPHE